MLPPGLELKDVDVWFQDETRVGQQGTVTRLWAPKGTRPRAIRQQQYEYTYLFGAVCAQRNEAVGLVLPAVGIDAMRIHLQLIAERVAPGRHAVVVADRAGWHTANALTGLDHLSWLPLPPASPELNPVEQVWQWLRDRELANRCYDSYPDTTWKVKNLFKIFSATKQ